MVIFCEPKIERASGKLSRSHLMLTNTRAYLTRDTILYMCVQNALGELFQEAKVVSLEEQPGRLSWATVNNILLVGWIVTRTSDIESRQKVHSVRFSSTWDTCLAVFCILSALTFISPTNWVDGPWLWVPILLSHRYSSRHRGGNTTGETPGSI